jgi:hypothetical protein
MAVCKASIAALVLVVCVFAASSASAEQRAYTCGRSAATLSYVDGHCKTKGTGEFGSTLITAAGTKITGTNSKTTTETQAAMPFKLKGTIGSFVTEIICTNVSLTGELTNAAKSVSAPITIVFSMCTVTRPAEKGCVVKGGFAITTKQLVATTVGQAANGLKFAPKEGTEIATVEFEGCSNPSLNNEPFRFTGSFVASASGATVTMAHNAITEQNTLKWGPFLAKAGLEGAITISAGEDAVILE